MRRTSRGSSRSFACCSNTGRTSAWVPAKARVAHCLWHHPGTTTTTTRSVQNAAALVHGLQRRTLSAAGFSQAQRDRAAQQVEPQPMAQGFPINADYVPGGARKRGKRKHEDEEEDEGGDLTLAKKVRTQKSKFKSKIRAAKEVEEVADPTYVDGVDDGVEPAGGGATAAAALAASSASRRKPPPPPKRRKKTGTVKSRLMKRLTGRRF